MIQHNALAMNQARARLESPTMRMDLKRGRHTGWKHEHKVWERQVKAERVGHLMSAVAVCFTVLMTRSELDTESETAEAQTPGEACAHANEEWHRFDRETQPLASHVLGQTGRSARGHRLHSAQPSLTQGRAWLVQSREGQGGSRAWGVAGGGGSAPMKALRSSFPRVSPSFALGILRCRKLNVANHGKLPTLTKMGSPDQSPGRRTPLNKSTGQGRYLKSVSRRRSDCKTTSGDIY